MGKKLTKEQVGKRILELETLYGQTQLSKLLGISKSTLRRYRDGKTLPKQKSVFNKINNTYHRQKKKIVKSEVEKLKTRIKTRKKSQSIGQVKNRYGLIFPDYAYTSPASQFEGVSNFEKLIELHEQGYKIGWRGTKEIPLEVQFLIKGERLTRWGKVVNIVGIVTTDTSPKAENNFSGQTTSLRVFPTYYRLIRGLNKSLTYEEKMDKIREFFIESLQVERGYTLALLGYYFDENDEL